MEPPPIPPPLPPKMPGAGDAPPVIKAPPPFSPQAPRKMGNRLKLFLCGFAFLALAFAGFVSFRVYQMVQWARNHETKPSGFSYFMEASEQIGVKGAKASGNSDDAKKLAGEMSDLMLKLRNEDFSQSKEKSWLDTHEEFKTYCELRSNECVFLVHVPELRRFDKAAHDELGKEAWEAAQAVLAKEHIGSPGMKLAVGLRGIVLYDRVMIGRRVAEVTDDNTGLDQTEKNTSAERLLYDWFEPVAVNSPADDGVGDSSKDIKAPLSGPVEVLSESEEGFKDLVFYIEKVTPQADGSKVIRVRGYYKGSPVGFEVVLGAKWKKGSMSPVLPMETYSGVVLYRSVGAESDAFVQALDDIYGTRRSPKAMNKETSLNAVALEGNPEEPGKGPLKIKVFYEPDKNESYAEFFTNVKLAEHRLELHEKDEEYRTAVVKALEGR
jgi:hypothetical protein